MVRVYLYWLTLSLGALRIEASEIQAYNTTVQYNCLEIFECPSTSHEVIFPPGDFTAGFNFSIEYFDEVCQYRRELADCLADAKIDYTECGYVKSAIFGYTLFRLTMCTDTTTLKDSLVKIIPCLNRHSLQRIVISLIKKLIVELKLFSTWPPRDESAAKKLNNMSCRSIKDFTQETRAIAKDVCGYEYDDVIFVLTQMAASVAQKTLGFGCDEHLSKH